MIARWPFGDLTPFKYGLILADPPWQYKMRSSKGYKKSPEAHYPTMSHDELRALPVNQLAAPDCVLVMWAVWPKLDEALELIKHWGFGYTTGGSWTKTTKHGKRAFGTGYIVRSTTEPWLIATLGEPRFRDKSIRNLIESERREHSRKPPEMRQICERLAPEAWRCEIFATETWQGAEVWGNQLGKFDPQLAEAE
jgi:N6-adenosine-specific RNA methylase IME4